MFQFLSRICGVSLLMCAAGLDGIAQPLTPEGERALKSATTFRECDVCPEMVVVPTGSFTMGSPESEKARNSWEGPQHVVAFVRPFAVGKFEVTVEQFAAFARETRYDTGTTCWTFEGGTVSGRSGRSWRNPGYEQTSAHPAACLSWRDAKAYTEWLVGKTTGKPYRLLSEAEWEYAARARTTPGPSPRFSFGDDERDACTHSNALDLTAKQVFPGTRGFEFIDCNDGHIYAAPVGTFAGNGFGLHDIHGNVKEWTEDCFLEGQGYRGAPSDGSARSSGDCRFRVLRGGSWFSYARLLRAAFRYRGEPDSRVSDVGLRVARTLLPP
jgi:formylglycine-generating enzyme required for sulfatase activity